MVKSNHVHCSRLFGLVRLQVTVRCLHYTSLFLCVNDMYSIFRAPFQAAWLPFVSRTGPWQQYSIPRDSAAGNGVLMASYTVNTNKYVGNKLV